MAPAALAKVTSPPEGQPLRVNVRQLPLPPEVGEAVRRRCKKLGIWRRRCVQREEDQLKLQHFYGGKWVATLRTDEGPVVVAAADSLNNPLFDQQLSFLTTEERRRALIDSPTRLFDEESAILTPFPNES